jgi:predicted GNAT family acetyltransferase
MNTSMFTFHLVEPADYEEALNLFWNHFMPFEPATRLAGCCTKIGYRIHNLDLMLRDMLKRNMCFMAKSQQGDMVGVIFCIIDNKVKNTICESPTKSEYLRQGWPVDFTPVLLLLDQLCDHQKIMLDKGMSQMLDLFALVVRTDFRGQGIATQLITKALNEAKTMGIPLVCITCSSNFSQRCSVKLGFKVENSILYKDWYCEGQKIVKDEDIDPIHPAAISYFKILS